MQEVSWWAKAVMVGSVIAALSLMIGALGTKFGIWGFQSGFLGLGIGAVLAIAGFLVGILGYFLSGGKRPGNKKPLLIGTVISALILGVIGTQAMAARSVPPIHNISTDLDNPPAFNKIVALRGENSNSLTIDEKTAAAQREAYAGLAPIESTQTADQLLTSAEAVLRNMGMEVVAVNTDQGLIEATATSFWFGFKDDVAVRVQPSATGSRVDVRSVSRVGQSDLGANARRISQILEQLGSQ